MLLRWSDDLDRAGRAAEAIHIADEVVRRYSAGRVQHYELAADALWRKAEMLERGGTSKREAVISIVDETTTRYRDVPVPPVWPLNDIAQRLERDGHTAEALAIYDRVIGRYGRDTDKDLARSAAFAQLRKAEILENRGSRHHPEVIEILEDVALGPDADQAALAHHRLALLLERHGRRQEAALHHEAVVSTYRGSELVGDRMVRRSAEQLFAYWKSGPEGDRPERYASLIDRYGEDDVFRYLVAWTMFDLADELERRGRHDEAVAAYDRLIERYGNEPVWQATLGVGGAADSARKRRAALLATSSGPRDGLGARIGSAVRRIRGERKQR